ncbi:deleted in azoospermia-like [Rissa tridactyla]|uniref:deleted in azoospermia-like n=1 Tax=Rissa tridactyla TaxID=75485 RepID=UPI0023BAE135|nr:deleted in azoospermia-like [Rissa tridactyla]
MCHGSQPSAPWSGEDFATGRASHHERPFCGGPATWRRSAAPAAFRSAHGLTGRSSACPQLAVRFRREPSPRASGALKQLPSPSEGRFPFVPHRLRSVKPFSSAPRLVPRPFGEARSPQDLSLGSRSHWPASVRQYLSGGSTCCLVGRRRRSPPARSHVLSSANVEAQCAGVSEDNTRLSTTSQGYVLPEGKIMPNTVFVGGIDIRMNEADIRSFFERYGTVKEVKIITDRTGVSKGYGFVSFLENVDVQKIVESQINFHGKKLKLGPAIRKQQNLCSYVHPRPLVFNPPAPQFHSVWGNQNTETYMQPPAVMSPVTQYVQTYPYSSPAVLIQQQVPVGYQPAYNYQVQPQWLAGEQRNYVMPPVYTSVSYHCTEDPELIQTECVVPEPTQSSTNSPQKKSVDRSIQTVVSCLFNPENRLRNTFVSQEDYFKERKAHHFRKGRAVLKSV